MKERFEHFFSFRGLTLFLYGVHKPAFTWLGGFETTEYKVFFGFIFWKLGFAITDYQRRAWQRDGV